MSNHDDNDNSISDQFPENVEHTDPVEVVESVTEATDQYPNEPDVQNTIAPAKKRPDPLTIAFAILALVVIVGFGVYFYQYVKSNVSLGMTLTEFQTSYHATDGFFAISSVGLAFPDCTISESDPSGKKSNVEQFYSGEILSMMEYEINVSGSINKSNSFIRSMRVSATVPEGADIAEFQNQLCVIYMPFIQALYPKMSTEDAVAFSQNLFATKDVVIRDNIASSIIVDEAAGVISLNIVHKERS